MFLGRCRGGPQARVGEEKATLSIELPGEAAATEDQVEGDFLDEDMRGWHCWSAALGTDIFQRVAIVCRAWFSCVMTALKLCMCAHIRFCCFLANLDA